MKAFENFLHIYSTNGKKIIVFPQEPMLAANNVSRIDRFLKLGMTPSKSGLLENWFEGNNKIQELVKRYPNVKMIDTINNDLFTDAPYYRGQLVYLDDNHLNEIGAKQYSHFLLPIWKKYYL